MTFREKFHEEFPKEKDFNPASKWCPSAFDYETDWTCNPADYRIIGCGPEGLDCDKCWDREMPDRNQAPYFIIEIEPFMQSNDLRQDISEAEKSLNDKTVQKYMERFINFKENESEELIEVRSKGLKANRKAEGLSVISQMMIVLGNELKTAVDDVYTWQLHHDTERCRKVKRAYAVLERYGWTYTEEEKQILDGTHELYVPEEKK